MLAVWLGRLEGAELASVLRRRTLPSGEISDVYDLARALLTPDSLRRALVTLDRYALACIATVALAREPLTEDAVLRALRSRADTSVDAPAVTEGLRTARALALLVPGEDEAWSCPDQLAEELAQWPARGLPGAQELAVLVPPAVIEPAAQPDAGERDRAAAERAFRTLDILGELVASAQEAPIALLSRGSLPLPTARRLSESTGAELGAVMDVVHLAAASGLVRMTDGRLAAAPEAEHWQSLPASRRWLAVAARWLGETPPSLRQVLAARPNAEWGPSLREYVAWLFPAGGDWLPQVIEEFGRVALELGVLSGTAPSRFGSLLLAGTPEPAALAIDELLPEEGEKVYLLPDLSVVSPGPLRPDVERRLRRVAEPVSRGLAPTFRIGEDSLQTGLASGLDEAGIRELLTGLSLSGLPQPVDYLVSEASRRHGALRVSAARAEHAPAQTLVSAEDELLLSAVVADRALAVLGLLRIGPREATSRLGPDAVFWTLRDARQPVALDPALREPGVLAPAPAHRREPGRRAAEAEDRVGAIVERVLAARQAASEQPSGDHSGRLQLAIKDRRPVRVTVTLPNGGSAEYQLVPTALVGGRVRGVDPAAQVERTLPLTSITAVTTVD